MNLDDWHMSFALTCLLLVSATLFPVASRFLPRTEEPFLAMAVLGEGSMAERYYPGDDPRISVGELVKWNLYLYNSMGQAQYVAVRVKVLGPGVEPPNSTSCSPSPAQSIFEIRRVLVDNETWISPLEWRIVDMGRMDGMLNLTSLEMNGKGLNVDVLAPDGSQLRMVLELWLYDAASDEFRFGWVSQGSPRCVWNQIWFNVTSTR